MNKYFLAVVIGWGVWAVSGSATQGYAGRYVTEHGILARSGRPAGAVILDNPLSDTVATAGTRFLYAVPANTFRNEDTDPLAYTARLLNGDPLPDWLTFDAALATFSGVPTNDDFGDLTVLVTAQNADSQTADDNFKLMVRAIPEVDLNGLGLERRRHLDFMTEDGTDSVKITSSSMFIRDLDGTTITKAIISFSEADAYDQDDEYLLITDAGMQVASDAGIKADDNASGSSVPSYDEVTGDIALVGEAPLEDYVRFFKEIFYVNISEDIEGGIRTIAFLVTDADGNDSNISITDIDVSPDNDPPTLDVDIDNDHQDGSYAYSSTFVEDGAAVPITDHDVQVTDIDHDDIAQIVVSVVNRKDGAQEVLGIAGSLPFGFTYGYDATNGVDLVIDGNGSLADYEAALRAIVYHNDSQDPDDTPREIRITYNDLGTNGLVQETTLIYIIPQNDPPDARTDTLVVAEHSKNNPFSIPPPSDIDNELDELSVTIDALPALGTVTRADGTPLVIGDKLLVTAFGSLQYDTPDNYDGITSPGELLFTVEDDSAATASSTIVFVINNAPEADDFIATTPEDTNYVFTLADFASEYTDVENDRLASIVVNSLPANGLLLLEGDTVRVGDEVRITTLDSGKLVLILEQNAYGNPYTSFLFRVKDERTATSEPYVASIIVTPVSDPPTVDTVFVNGEENEPVFFTAEDFINQFSDPEDDTLVFVRIESLPSNGILLLNNEPITIDDEIAGEALSQLTFVPNAGFDGITQFRWNGYDGSAYAERSAPVIITLAEDNRIVALNDTIQLVDITVYDGTLASLVVNPTGGDFVFSTMPVVATQHGTLVLSTDGTYTYQTTEDFAGPDRFTFEVCDTNVPPKCAQATVVIHVAEPLLVYEGFSPDNDGTNDIWRIRGIENHPDNVVRIFNRWGNLVFEIEGYNNQDKAWSSYSTAGLVAGDVPDGTYFYLIDLDNGESPRSGYVIVNR